MKGRYLVNYSKDLEMNKIYEIIGTKLIGDVVYYKLKGSPIHHHPNCIEFLDEESSKINNEHLTSTNVKFYSIFKKFLYVIVKFMDGTR